MSMPDFGRLRNDICWRLADSTGETPCASDSGGWEFGRQAPLPLVGRGWGWGSKGMKGRRQWRRLSWAGGEPQETRTCGLFYLNPLPRPSPTRGEGALGHRLPLLLPIVMAEPDPVLHAAGVAAGGEGGGMDPGITSRDDACEWVMQGSPGPSKRDPQELDDDLIPRQGMWKGRNQRADSGCRNTQQQAPRPLHQPPAILPAKLTGLRNGT